MGIGKKIDGLGEMLDVPSGMLEDFTLEFYSKKEAVLTGSAEVLELDDSVLKLKCREHEITFRGSGLHISYYTADGIKVVGSIASVEFD